jgi:hypothetical protein
MTLQDLITKLNGLANSNPKLLNEQVSILEPDLEDGVSSYEIENVFIDDNGSVSLLIVI